MKKFRELNLEEKKTLIYALAQARTEAYDNAVALHDESDVMEDSGESGYAALSDEADQYEMLADLTDMLVEFICEGRLVVKTKEDEAYDAGRSCI